MSRLGLPDVEIRGHGVNNTNERNTGALAHLLSGKVSLVWATGEVVADDGKGRVGGLVRGVGNTGEGTSGDMRESWFVGKVRGETSVGGLVGFGARGNISDSWAMARVESSETRGGNIGGLIGFAFGGFSLARSWSGGWRDTNANAHALVAGSPNVQKNNYFDRAISRSGVLMNESVIAVDTMVTVSRADADWNSTLWNFGDTDLSGDNPAADYPFLQGIENLWPGMQAAAFAGFQTRILPVAGGAELPTKGHIELMTEESITLTLDTNGLAAGAPTPTPTCDTEDPENDRGDGENELQRCDGAIAGDRRRFGGVYE